MEKTQFSILFQFSLLMTMYVVITNTNMFCHGWEQPSNTVQTNRITQAGLKGHYVIILKEKRSYNERLKGHSWGLICLNVYDMCKDNYSP